MLPMWNESLVDERLHYCEVFHHIQSRYPFLPYPQKTGKPAEISQIFWSIKTRCFFILSKSNREKNVEKQFHPVTASQQSPVEIPSMATGCIDCYFFMLFQMPLLRVDRNLLDEISRNHPKRCYPKFLHDHEPQSKQHHA
ncbi:hypothetical protein MNBD_PLANCTO02-1980 [hydrothermal vent metagenome]|uniref:Uncharacterized protein n=1 Tax=hydrothermal vent metagenome TaxID=652676 RepID=A0A3B1D785_9ZZZZ